MTETALVPQGTMEITSQFGTQSGFELLQRQAKMLANSYMVPTEFSIFNKEKKLKPAEEQAYAIANAVIAIEMAMRIGASPLMVAQNLIPIYGKPTWSSQFVIACINASGRFSPLRFAVSGEGDDKTCIAWALEKRTSERLEGPPVSIQIAKKEGWYGKNGSKWQTMPELMLRYRAATFFGRLYAPDLLMGMRSVDEAIDVGDDVIDISPENDTIDDINAEIKKHRKAPAKPADLNSQPISPPSTVQPPQSAPVSGPVDSDEPTGQAAEPPREDLQNGAIPPKIAAELKEVDGKETVDALDTWAYKHHKRLEKQYGQSWAKWIFDHIEKRRAFLRAEAAPGEDPPTPVVVNEKPDDIVMVACPEAGGRMIPMSDCDTGSCRETCEAYQAMKGEIV